MAAFQIENEANFIKAKTHNTKIQPAIPVYRQNNKPERTSLKKEHISALHKANLEENEDA